MGDRGPGDPAAWAHYALDPTHTDDALVTAAFTLARIDSSLSQGPQKAQLDQIHEQLWRRLVVANPPYLQNHARA